MLRRYGRDTLQSSLESYQPIYESRTASFLKRNAIEMELRDVSRTYLAISEDLKVLGFITLSIRCMRVPDDNLLSGKTLKKMNIEQETGVAQSYLIGQLSRSRDAPKGLGHELLDVAFEYLGSAKRLVGCRMVRLDCRDELVPYYSGHGFKMIARDPDENLNQMMALMTAGGRAVKLAGVVDHPRHLPHRIDPIRAVTPLVSQRGNDTII